MADYWKILAFPGAATAGYLVSLTATSYFRTITGLSELPSSLILVAAVALVAGWLLDDVIPTYIESKIGDSSDDSVGDFGGDGSGDLDLD
jgi:hypothetical protein